MADKIEDLAVKLGDPSLGTLLEHDPAPFGNLRADIDL